MCCPLMAMRFSVFFLPRSHPLENRPMISAAWRIFWAMPGGLNGSAPKKNIWPRAMCCNRRCARHGAGRIDPSPNRQESIGQRHVSLIQLQLDRSTLEDPALEKILKSAYRRQAKLHHPDAGGEAADFRKIRNAYEALIRWAENPVFSKRRGFPGPMVLRRDHESVGPADAARKALMRIGGPIQRPNGACDFERFAIPSYVRNERKTIYNR